MVKPCPRSGERIGLQLNDVRLGISNGKRWRWFRRCISIWDERRPLGRRILALILVAYACSTGHSAIAAASLAAACNGIKTPRWSLIRSENCGLKPRLLPFRQLSSSEEGVILTTCACAVCRAHKRLVTSDAHVVRCPRLRVGSTTASDCWSDLSTYCCNSTLP